MNLPIVSITDANLGIVCEMIQLWLEREKIDVRLAELRALIRDQEDVGAEPDEEDDDDDEEEEDEEPEPDLDEEVAGFGEVEELPVRMHNSWRK